MRFRHAYEQGKKPHQNTYNIVALYYQLWFWVLYDIPCHLERNTHTHTHIHTHTDTQTHRDTHRHKHTHTHTHTRARAHAHTQRHTNTQRHTHRHKHTHTLSHTYTHRQTDTHTHTHILHLAISAMIGHTKFTDCMCLYWMTVKKVTVIDRRGCKKGDCIIQMWL
jgi:hypothetical protein